MITLAMVQAGYEEGHIRLIESPNGDGIACQIGDNWFYFGGQTAEEYKDVEEYKNMFTSVIIKEIFNVLEDFSTELEDEYLYYDYFLRTQIEKNVFTEAPHERYQPQIISVAPVDEQDMIYTVSLEPGYMVDVKACSENGLVYVMQNQNGNSVYGIAGQDAAFRNYCFDEKMVVEFVKENHLKREMVGLNISEAASKLRRDFYILEDQSVNHNGSKYVFVKPPDRRLQLTTDKDNKVVTVKGNQRPTLDNVLSDARKKVRIDLVKDSKVKDDLCR